MQPWSGDTGLKLQLLGRHRLGGSWFKAGIGRKDSETPIAINKLDVVEHISNPSTEEAQIGGSQSEAGPREKHKTLPKK
jgi:hypothetical protein